MTNRRRTGLFVAILVLTAAAGGWRGAAAQASRNDEVLPALLTEVKGLRAAMEQMASGSTQAQLLVGRLQLQEQRVTSMIRRLDTVRDNLAAARTQYNQIAGSVKMLAQNDDPADKESNELNDVLAGLKSQVGPPKRTWIGSRPKRCSSRPTSPVSSSAGSRSISASTSSSARSRSGSG